MYHDMTYEEVMRIVENPTDYSEYDRKCAIYNFKRRIDINKISIKEYEKCIEKIKKG